LKSRIVFGPNFAATADGCNHRAIVQSSRSRLQRVFSKSPAEGGGQAHTPHRSIADPTWSRRIFVVQPGPTDRIKLARSALTQIIASGWCAAHY
jgi:hypothetical protein